MASRPNQGEEGLRPLLRYQRRRVRAWGRGSRRRATSIMLAVYPCEVRRALLRLSRSALEDAIEQMVARLDVFDGDADLELNGDESEDSEGDGWVEGQLIRLGDCEDDEDDDPAGGNVEDELQADEPMWQEQPQLFSIVS